MTKNIHNYTPNELAEILKCRDDPIYFCRNYFYISHPILGPILFDLYEYQENLIRNYIENKFVVELSTRQAGCTAVLTAYTLWYAMFQSDKNVLILTEKMMRTGDFISRIRYAYDRLPEWLRGDKVPPQNKHAMGFPNGSRILGGSINCNSVRGLSVDLLCVDGMAYSSNENQAEFWITALSCLTPAASCIILSGANKPKDTFHAIWSDAHFGVTAFVPIMVDWDAPPGRDEKFKFDTIKMIGERAWKSQYECDFLRDG